jgi:nucleotide-binding universal stress UspA family protein
VFTRLLVGLDGSPRADVALEQALLLGRRMRATIVVAHVQPRGDRPGGGSALLERARERVAAAQLPVELVERQGSPDAVLAELAHDADAVLIGRRGVTTTGDAVGPTAAAVVRATQTCVIVCGGTPSPMQAVALAFDGRETSRRALEIVAQFASIVHSTVHLIHASDNRDAGLLVLGEAEATLSLQGVNFVSHVEPGTPGEVVARVVKRTQCDALFAGAHVSRETPDHPSLVVDSHVEQILRHTDLPVVIQP